jgi:hypothetical protein
MPALVDAALAVKVNVVLLVMDKTVPMTTLPAVFMIFPTLISVRNDEPTPVTVGERVEVVMVPVLAVLGQAVALQFPEPTDEIVAAMPVDPNTRTAIIDRMPIFKDFKYGLVVWIWSLIFIGFDLYINAQRTLGANM